VSSFSKPSIEFQPNLIRLAIACHCLPIGTEIFCQSQPIMGLCVRLQRHLLSLRINSEPVENPKTARIPIGKFTDRCHVLPRFFLGGNSPKPLKGLPSHRHQRPSGPGQKSSIGSRSLDRQLLFSETLCFSPLGIGRA
jgi:hypothetical protein